jgi:hypothetical protein
MQIRLGDVLDDSDAEGLLLTVDGAAEGMEGAIARAFGRRWPALWEMVADEIPFPMGLGEVVEVPLEANAAFRGVVLASTLNHADSLDERARKNVARTATENALRICAEAKWNRLASAVLVGGWRLPLEAAFLGMVEGYEAAQPCPVELRLSVKDAADHSRLLGLARSLGLVSR